MIQAAFGGLQQRFAQPEPDMALLSSEQSYRGVRSRSMDLEVRTRDGDLVQLSFADHREQQFHQTYDARGRMQYQQHLSQQQVQIRVQGDLDENERAEIDALIRAADEAGSSFFEGEGLGIDMRRASDLLGSELSEFSLSARNLEIDQYTERSRHAPDSRDLPKADSRNAQGTKAASEDSWHERLLDRLSSMADERWDREESSWQGFRERLERALDESTLGGLIGDRGDAASWVDRIGERLKP